MINDVEELIALGAGDKYRLNDTRERLERGKKLYISDLEYLEVLVKTHLRRRLSPEPRKPKRVIRRRSVEESEPSQPQTESGQKSRKEELKEYEKKYGNYWGALLLAVSFACLGSQGFVTGGCIQLSSTQCDEGMGRKGCFYITFKEG